jgi:ribosomal protein S18 acetylase RimI-like enzyme
MAKPSSPIEIRIADAATAEVVEAFARLLPQLSSSATTLGPEVLREILAAPHNTVFLARDPSSGGRIVGTLTLVIFRIPTAIRAWIEDVVVDDVARGRGVGEALTLAAVKLARERGAKTVDLTSRRSRQAAHRLYEKAGFHVRDTSVYRFGPKPGA